MSGEEGKTNGTPWPKALARLQTGPSERRPAAYHSSSDSSPGSIASAPSRWRTATGGPSSSSGGVEVGDRAARRRMWPGALEREAGARRPRWRRRRRPRARSGGGRLELQHPVVAEPATRASSPGEEVKTAKIPPRIPPARIRGRSRWPPRRPVARSAWSSRVSASLWPSKTASTDRP